MSTMEQAWACVSHSQLESEDHEEEFYMTAPSVFAFWARDERREAEWHWRIGYAYLKLAHKCGRWSPATPLLNVLEEQKKLDACVKEVMASGDFTRSCIEDDS